MSSWSQLFFLCLFSFLGLVFLSVILLLVQRSNPELLLDTNFTRVTIFLQSTLIFLVPACLCAYLFQQNAFDYLKINKKIDFKILLLSILLIIVIQPLISFTGYYNNTLTLPESFAGIESQMKIWEELAKATTEKLLITDSTSILLFNLFVIAVIAGITEEFFFRGSLQQIMKKICCNKHVAVWITAFIFSAIHFQFYGFIPRLLLGALLGYIFVWSANLWIPVIVHTINNAMSVLVFHFYHDTEVYQKAEAFGSGDTWWVAIISVAVSGIVIYFLSKEYIENKIEDITL